MDVIQFILDLSAFYAIYLMLSLSLNLEYGMAGIPNFGKVMFFAGGAFVVGALASRLIAPLAGINLAAVDFYHQNAIIGIAATRYLAQHPGIAISLLIFMMILGAAAGAVLGILASYPAIRLREDFLGILLVASGELLRIIARNYEPLVCGSLGVIVPDPFAWISSCFLRWVARSAFMLSVAFGCWALLNRLANSPYGRLLRAIREDELAAASLGKDVAYIRMRTLAIGSAIAGVAGALFAFYVGAVHVDDYTPLRTFIVWVMVILGGAGNNAGAALGAFLYVLCERLFRQLKYYIAVPFDIDYVSYMLFSVLLIALLLWRPEGLLPERPPRIIDYEKVRARVKARLAAEEDADST